MDKQQISEEYIAIALRYLKYHDPEHANREEAIALVEDLQSGFHGIARHNPELLLKLRKELDSHKASKQADDNLASE